MPASQDHIGTSTSMGANPAPGGCTFRLWAPRAKAVHACGTFNGWAVDDALRLSPGPAEGHWAGYFPGVGEGAEYKFWVVGESGPG
jgi:1,4-alpha-glucan branching enzyme